MKTPKIIIGQSDSLILNGFSQAMAHGAYEVHIAPNGDRILELVRMGVCPDLVLMESSLVDPDPFSICKQLKSNPDLNTIPILLVMKGDQENELNKALQAGFDDILMSSVHSNVLQARVQSLLRLKFLTDESDDGESVLYTLTRTIEAKDPYTLGHADRVAQFAVELGKACGAGVKDLETLRKGGMLHDLGKIAIPDAILLKPGRYTPEEFDIMKRHPTLGCDICHRLKSVKSALPLIKHHHEKLDGSGYPDGLKGDQISPFVRMVTIVDIYDALRSQRTYKEAFSLEKSFKIMWEEADKGWWDKDILARWEKLVRSKNGNPSEAV